MIEHVYDLTAWSEHRESISVLTYPRLLINIIGEVGAVNDNCERDSWFIPHCGIEVVH